jgi:arginase
MFIRSGMKFMKKITIIGVPLKYGQSSDGIDKGPLALREAGLISIFDQKEYEIDDLGDIKIEVPKPIDNPKLKNLEVVASSNTLLAQYVDKTIERKSFPLVIGGDHSMAIGTIAGLSKHYSNLGVIWYDAHGDINTEITTPSGNIHGMSLAVSMGIGHPILTNILGINPKIKPENIVFIGTRSLDEGEVRLIKENNIKVFSMEDINTHGIERVVSSAIDYLEVKTTNIHLSFDIDALDPSEAPGVGVPELGGISLEDSILALKMLRKPNLISSVEFVEANPLLDIDNKTIKATIKLIQTFFEI